MAPVRSVGTPAVDLIGPMPYAALNTMLDGAYPRGARNYWRSAFLKELNDQVLGVLVDAFERVPSPMTSILIEHFHGAVTRVDPTATAYPHREPGYNFAITGEWLDPADDDANIEWIRATFDAVAPYTADAAYMNYLGDDEGERVRAAYGPNSERLVTLKRRWTRTTCSTSTRTSPRKADRSDGKFRIRGPRAHPATPKELGHASLVLAGAGARAHGG